jgi:anti-anti-sigma factor
MDLRATPHRIGGRLVVTLDGSADLATAPRLDSRLRAVVTDNPTATIHVDLDGLIALDDVALGVLLGVAGSARSAGGDLVAVCSDASRRQRLMVTGFTRAVTVLESLSDPHDESGTVAVIFTSHRTSADPEGYAEAAARMDELSRARPGYLGIESARGDDGVGITVSYWRSAADAAAWKQDHEHLLVQEAGRDRWYDWYRVRVAVVDRSYRFTASDQPSEIFHLALPDDWQAALSGEDYTISTRGVSLDEEGFIHCSYPTQIEGVANRFYSDLAALVILRVDTRLLGTEVRVEPAIEGGSDLFPHVYGPIPIAAVVATTPWHRDDDGQWRHPPTR